VIRKEDSHERGDIVVVDGHEKSLTVRRLALVVGVEENEDHLQVMLCHDDLPLLSIVDAIIMSSESGLSYDLVVETDLYSAIWKSQVAKTIGKVPPALVGKIMTHAADPDALVDGVQSGYAIRGVIDPRWKFKEIEGNQFRSLCADCVSTLLTDRSVTVDLDIFTLCDEDEIYRFFHLVKEKDLVLTDEDLVEIEARGLFLISFWKERFPEFGFGDVFYGAFIQLPQIRERVERSVEIIANGRIREASPLIDAGFPIITSKNLWLDFDSISDSATVPFQLLAI
jgi:hypothetical protein